MGLARQFTKKDRSHSQRLLDLLERIIRYTAANQDARSRNGEHYDGYVARVEPPEKSGVHFSAVRGSEAVPYSADGLDQVFVIAQLLAYATYVDVDVPVDHVGATSDDAAEQLVAREDSPGVGREQMEQTELARGQVHTPAI